MFAETWYQLTIATAPTELQISILPRHARISVVFFRYRRNNISVETERKITTVEGGINKQKRLMDYTQSKESRRIVQEGYRQ